MVKQGSFFQRLKDRWGSGSGVRVDARGSSLAKGRSGDLRNGNGGNGDVRPGDRASAPVQRVEPERAVARELPPEPIEPRSTRKMSDREEAMLALGSHFQELTALLRGSQARVDDQLGKLVGATTALTQLPALGQQQLDTLRALSVQMERQNSLGEQLAGTMTKLPSLLTNVESALARAAATDERTAATVREFQSTMDRIHGAMGQMVQQGEQHVRTAQGLAERRDEELKNLATGIEQSQHRAAAELQRTTDAGLQTLRQSHEDQSNRLQRIVQEHAGWNRAVLVGIGVVVLGIGGLIALQLFR
jgi:hypothetical protein